MIDLKNKLKGLPKIYYINLDNRIDRREYMETQFDYWGIKDYHRVSGTKYLASKYEEWKYVIDNFEIYEDYHYKINPAFISNFITHLEMIKNWLETTNEDYMIMMEDDYDLSLIEYWNFDWEYLMNNIPYDWDCIQLGFDSYFYIHFFLHPKTDQTSFGVCMINRHYAKKLIKLYTRNDKIYINAERNNYKELKYIRHVDYSICNNGKVYCIPLIPQNPNFSSYENFIKLECQKTIDISYEIYYKWWKEEHHKFTVEDFFTYGKPNDWEMTKEVKLEEIKKKFNYN